eukprot:CAMPEP_0119264738 /NCGR_PEP_ID=MMETSP1329-20130426/3749_1 /TAXON_ID=114041 /ORGANISM="Genus nov. species nov., Strain RCC1024" /LENGTH=328 /DNA_ID=CAMNT_0007264529 /DNA_START=251 /DNA_END=1233 /DNA_ORIENTATION=-
MASFNSAHNEEFAPFSAYEALYTPATQEIGRGASGVVRRATRKSDGEPVAVKMMDLRALRLSGGDTFSLARLRREVDVLRTLRHPSIVRLLGAYGDADSVWLVMELVEGRELFDAILARGSYDEDAARPLFRAILEAVAYMHARHVLHRDLKPENVLVCGPDESTVKLVDFGLSKLVAGSTAGASRAQTMVGTPSYLAPEIEQMKTRTSSIDLDALDEDGTPRALDLAAGAQTYDDRVDSWSLGVTLYVMLVARFPVYERDESGLIMGVKLPAALSVGARGLLARLLDPDPKTRASARASLADPWFGASMELALTPPSTPPTETKAGP